MAPPLNTPHMATSASSNTMRDSLGSDNTFVMARSPRKVGSASAQESYLPRIITTIGEKPACLVNASMTYTGNDEIYLFGGFDHYSDEVYNHVLKLSIAARRWSLVDNFGDIPGVRMGHTACLWQGDKILVFGGENEHRSHLSDVIVFDLNTAYWNQPDIGGPIPRGRARHAAVIHDDKLFVSGGMMGDNAVLDDVCYLDLKTWTWSRNWRFVSRYDHSLGVYNNKLWVSGGISDEMERTGDLWWLDFTGVPAFQGAPSYGVVDRANSAPSSPGHTSGMFTPASTRTDNSSIRSVAYTANSSSIQVSPASHHSRRQVPIAPGNVSALKFVSSPHLPTQHAGLHFHVFSSGLLLDFATPADGDSSDDTSLSALDLESLGWQKLADGKDLFRAPYRWHYCCLDEDGTHAWLLGSPMQNGVQGTAAEDGEKLSDVLHVDLRKLGLLGNKLTQESRSEAGYMPASDSQTTSHLSSIGADLSRTFDIPPEAGSGADFIVTAISDSGIRDDDDNNTSQESSVRYSQPVHVHRFILSARWPHFARLYNAEMTEFHTRKMHIPESYSAVRAFLYYLYTDSISAEPAKVSSTLEVVHSPSLEDVAGMLVMSSIYDMPRLRHLCVSRLVRELDVQHAALVFLRASTAQEAWLKRRAASFCMIHWGRVVRTEAFRRLPRDAMLELCEEVDAEGRVVGGDELEAVGGLGGGRLGQPPMYRDGRKRGRANRHRHIDAEGEAHDDESMDME